MEADNCYYVVMIIKSVNYFTGSADVSKLAAENLPKDYLESFEITSPRATDVSPCVIRGSFCVP